MLHSFFNGVGGLIVLLISFVFLIGSVFAFFSRLKETYSQPSFREYVISLQRA